jgi:hypothetical protein
MWCVPGLETHHALPSRVTCWLLNCRVSLEVAPEIIRVEKQKDAAAGFIANTGSLFFRACTGKKQAAFTRTWRRDNNPTLVLCRNERVLDKLKGPSGLISPPTF